MKKLNKIIILLTLVIIVLQGCILTKNSFAKGKAENETPINPDLLIPESVKKEREEEKQRKLEEESTDYTIFSDEDKVKFKKIIEIKEEYQTFIAIGGVVLLIVLIMVIKTKVIEASTKTCIAMAVIAIAAYMLKGMVTGNIIYILNTFIQLLGVILIVLSNFFIYKHDNLLMYIPICVLGIYYSITHLEAVKSSILLQIFLVIAPIALYILGTIMRKAKEIELLIPVKEKHERKKDENK